MKKGDGYVVQNMISPRLAEKIQMFAGGAPAFPPGFFDEPTDEYVEDEPDPRPTHPTTLAGGENPADGIEPKEDSMRASGEKPCSGESRERCVTESRPTDQEKADPLKVRGALADGAGRSLPTNPRTTKAAPGHTCEIPGDGAEAIDNVEYDLRCAGCVAMRIHLEGPMLPIGAQRPDYPRIDGRIYDAALAAAQYVEEYGDCIFCSKVWTPGETFEHDDFCALYGQTAASIEARARPETPSPPDGQVQK